MAAGTQDITIEQGAVWTQQYTYEDSNNVAIDLTGDYIAMQVRESYNSATALATATTSNGKIVLTDAVNGVFAITLEPADTTAITASGVYDIEISNGGDTTTTLRLIQGRVTLSKEVTKV